MKKIFTMLFCLMAIAICFMSCSKDSDEEKRAFNESDLIGVWESYDGEAITINFTFGYNYSLKASDRVTLGLYAIKDNIIMWDKANLYPAKILSLDKNQLVLEFYKARSIYNTNNDIIHFKRKLE